MNRKQYQYLGAISVFFVAVLLISNVAAAKIVQIGWLSFDGGTLLFPLSYIFGDILTEVYGYKRSRSVIWLGFFSAAVMSLIFLVVGLLPASPEWGGQDAYDTILGFVPRIVGASLIAYLAGEFCNSFVLAKMKIATKGRWLWTRTIGSTLVGELVDSAIFVIVAFAGIFSSELLVTMFISNYLFKTAVEILFTPVTYKTVAWLKKKESEDYYDFRTNFNPFSMGE